MIRVHINQLVIRHNKKYGNKLPPVRVEDLSTKVTTYGFGVKFSALTSLTYSPDKPLPCGAKLWIETSGPVYIDRPVPYAKVKAKMEAFKAKHTKKAKQPK